jgi:hypothetical protein
LRPSRRGDPADAGHCVRAAIDEDVIAPARFELRRRLGAGGMGVVYEALDRDSGTPVALKTLHDLTAEALYRLKREFRMLQGLQHPNLCQLYELFEHDGRWFISMELVRGQDFLGFVRAAGDDDDDTGEVPLPGGAATAPGIDASRLRATLAQLGEGLCALHDAGLVHRDIKPSNVLVTSTGRVVVLDFGFVADSGLDEAVRSATVVGTPAYMAPEQALSGAVGPAADWFSAGVMAYEAMTGRLPHDGDTVVALLINKQCADPPAPRALVPSLPPDLDQLCVDLLQVDPARRPSGRAVLRRLGAPTARHTPTMSVTALGGGFVGRDRELVALRRAYQDSQGGQAVTALVIGPSGVGKSALTRHFAGDIEGDGALVVKGRCYERESVPYKAFDGVIDALSRHLRTLTEIEAAKLTPRHHDALLRMFPVLGGVPALARAPVDRPGASDPQEQRNRAFSALRDLCHRLASRRPLVIAIDDWQWADEDSVLLARDLVRHRDSPPVLLLLSTRPPEDAAVAARIDAVATAESRRIELDLLDGGDATELARRLLAAFAPSAAISPRELADEARGHPLYIAELVRHIATHGVGERRGMRLEEAIASRVAELPASVRAIVEALAVAGVPLPAAVLRDAVGLAAADFQRQTAVLRLGHLVHTTHQETALEIYHDRVRAAVAETMTVETRIGWHRRLADAIEASPVARDRPELLLQHLEASGQGSRAVDLAIQAARRSHQAAAFEQASSLYRTALRLGTFEPARLRELQQRLGEALANAGRGPEAAALFLEAAEGAGPAERLECQRQAAEQLLISGHLERGLAILSELLREVGGALPATPRRALASVAWGRARLKLRGLGWTPKHESQIAPEALRRLDVLRVVSHGLAMVDNIRGADFNTRWLLAALRTGEPERVAMALGTEAAFLGSQGGKAVDRAAALVAVIGRLAEDQRDPRLAAWHLSTRGFVEYWGCRLPEARATLIEAEARYDDLPRTSWEIKNSRMFLAYVLRHMGAWRELRTRLEGYIGEAERRGDTYVLGSMRRYCSVLMLGDDDPGAARHMVDSVRWPTPDGAFHVQHWYELEALAEIGLYTRDVSTVGAALEPLFARLGRSMLLRVHIIRALAVWLRARLALAADGGDEREQLRRASHLASDLAGERDPRALLAAHLVRAALADRRGDDAGAVAALRAAVATGAAASVRLMTAVCQRRLGEIVGGDEGAGLLTAAAATFTAEGIVAPGRFTDQYAPGFRAR